MGQPPLMLLSLTDEGTAETRSLAWYTPVLYTTCVARKFGKPAPMFCTSKSDEFFSSFHFFFQYKTGHLVGLSSVPWGLTL